MATTQQKDDSDGSYNGEVPCANISGMTIQLSSDVNYMWTLNDFTSLYINQVEEIQTGYFCLNEGERRIWWRLKLKIGSNNQEYIQIVLQNLLSDSTIITTSVRAEVSIVNITSGRKIMNKSFGYCSTSLTEWSIPQFIEKKCLFKNAECLIFGNSLTILCEIWYTGICNTPINNSPVKILKRCKQINSNVERQKKGYVYDDKDSVLEDYSKLYENPVFTDATIDVKGTIFKVHKAIVSARCPVFCDIFNPENNLGEQKINVVTITDIRPKIFRELLRYIYSGEVKNIEIIVSDLIIAADKYRLDRLKTMCEKTICDHLNAKNAVEFLGVSEQLQSKYLKQKVLKFIEDNTAAVIENNNLNTADLVRKIVQSIIP